MKPRRFIMMPSMKRKQKRLSVLNKVEIIKRLDRGETGASLAKNFNVHAATICDIKGKKAEILHAAKELESYEGFKRRKITKRARNLETEDAVYSWFVEMKNQGKWVSGPVLCQKALELNKKLGGPSKFKASTAWLRNFKYRHGIRFKEGLKEAFSNDAPTAACFRESVLRMVEEEGFCMDDIYSADETRICLKSLVCESLTNQPSIADEEPVTVMVCANASGQHALSLYVVTKFADAKNFRDKSSQSIKYKVQKNSWMDYDTFLDWFTHHFIPEVKRYRVGEGMTGKVLLLVDNSSSHSPLEELNKVDDNFIVSFLPSEVEQPTNQGVTQKVETIYVKNLSSLLSSRDSEESFADFLNALSVKDCCSVLANAWKSLSEGNFKKAWQRFWKALDEAVAQERNPDKTDTSKNLLRNIPEFPEQQHDYEEQWLVDEMTDPSDETVNEEIQGINKNEVDGEGGTPSHAEALIAFQTVLKWCEEQPECTSDEISLLKWMKDLAERKMQSSI